MPLHPTTTDIESTNSVRNITARERAETTMQTESTTNEGAVTQLERNHHYMMANAALRTAQENARECPPMAALLPVAGEGVLEWYERYETDEMLDPGMVKGE